MRILALLPCLPFPANNGQKHRFSQLLRDLALHDEVALLCFADEADRRRYSGEHDRLFATLKTVPLSARTPADRAASWLSFDPSDVRHFESPTMAKLVDEEHARLRPDVLLVGDPALTRYVLPHRDTPRVLDYVCEFLLQARRMQDLAQGPAKALWALRRRKYAWFLRRIARVYDLCLLNSQEDLDSLRAAWPDRRLEVVANGLALDEYPFGLEPAVANRLIYPGSTTYPPNLDAVRFFAEKIMPLVRAEIPEAELQVTGAAPPADMRPRGEGIVYTGHLSDVRRAIAGAWACVVPLRLGAGGARLKVLEALALGTPVVATAVGYEGVAVTDDVDILAAEEPAEFARRTVEVLRSPAKRARLAAAGRQLIESRYDVRVLGKRYRSLLHEVAATPRASAA